MMSRLFGCAELMIGQQSGKLHFIIVCWTYNEQILGGELEEWCVSYLSLLTLAAILSCLMAEMGGKGQALQMQVMAVLLSVWHRYEAPSEFDVDLSLNDFR